MAKVLVVGQQEEAQTVQGYLTNYDALCQGSSPAAEMDALPSFIILETKYYSARLDLFLCELERGGEYEELAGKEGYLMCLSVEMANNTTSVASRQELFAKGEAAEDVGIAIRILVILGRDITLSEEARGAWMLWSLDHGFELIEIDASSLTDSWKEREKDGLPRLMEALQANMWSSMARKEATGNSNSSSSSSSSSADGGGGSSSVSSTSNVFEFQNKQGVATESKQETISEASAGASAFDEQYFRQMREADEANEQSAQAVDLSALDEGGGKEDSSELPAADASLDRFADILAQAKSTREAALSGKLSDHERRAQAAQMAMQLSQLLSMAGEDEDEDDEDEQENAGGGGGAAKR